MVAISITLIAVGVVIAGVTQAHVHLNIVPELNEKGGEFLSQYPVEGDDDQMTLGQHIDKLKEELPQEEYARVEQAYLEIITPYIWSGVGYLVFGLASLIIMGFIGIDGLKKYYDAKALR